MTAAAANADTPRFSTDAVPRAIRSLPVAASTHIYQGTLVALNLSGYLVPASADPSLTVVGVANDEADNSSGAAAAINCAVERGAFYLTNSSSTAAVSEADIGREVFAVDDLTVSRTNVAGTYPVAGRVIGFESSKPIVEVGMLGRTVGGRVDVLYPAGADLSSTGQNLFVKLNGSSQIVLADTAGGGRRGGDDGHDVGQLHRRARRIVHDGLRPRRRRERLAHEHLRQPHGGDPHHRGVIAD